MAVVSNGDRIDEKMCEDCEDFGYFIDNIHESSKVCNSLNGVKNNLPLISRSLAKTEPEKID